MQSQLVISDVKESNNSSCSANSLMYSDLSSVDRDVRSGESISVATTSAIKCTMVIPHPSEHPCPTKSPIRDHATSETNNNSLQDQVEPEDKQETNDTIIEADTSATLTANPNDLESFKMQQQSQRCVEDAQNIEVVEKLETQKMRHLANPPVLPKVVAHDDGLSNSIDLASCDEDDNHTPKKDYRQPKKEDSYEVATPSEVEDRSSMPTIGNTPLPTLNSTDHLCTGIAGSKIQNVESSSVATVVWVNPESPLNSVYKQNAVTKLPRLGKELGKGGNGRVFMCYITTSDNDELPFACKVEKKKPLYQEKKMEMFDKICLLSDKQHFVIVHAYLIVGKYPNDYVGYLLMEYFPLGNITSILGELEALDECNNEIKRIDKLLEQSQSDEEFGKHRSLWQKATKKRNKIMDCCKRLWHGIIDSLKHFHDQHLVHLDIKDYNVLLRKTCEHKDKFICKCDHPPFDVLIGDFDYCHKTSAIISCPKNTGTEVFQTLSMKDAKIQIAKPSLDLFGLLLTILRIRSKMGCKHECCSRMVDEWKAIVLTGGHLESKLCKNFSDTWKVKKSLARLASTNEEHKCAECKALKDKIALVASHMEPQKNGISEVTKEVWKHGTFLCEYFLKCTFADMDVGELLKYLTDTLHDILKDYADTFVENHV